MLFGGEGFLAGQSGGGRWEGHQQAVGGGGCYGAYGQELVYEALGGIAGGGFEDDFGGGRGKGVCVVAEEVAEVEGVGYGFCDCDGAGQVIQWWGGLGG